MPLILSNPQPRPFMLLELTWIFFNNMMSIKLAIFLLCTHNFPLIIQTSYSVNLPTITFPLIHLMTKLAPTSGTPCNHLCSNQCISSSEKPNKIPCNNVSNPFPHAQNMLLVGENDALVRKQLPVPYDANQGLNVISYLPFFFLFFF
jgi:hypothetical protein